MAEYPQDRHGDASGFLMYGGHRLWIAPEDRVLSYFPDNSALEVTPVEGGAAFGAGASSHLLMKEMTVRATPDHRGIHVQHSIKNTSSAETFQVANWGLTVLRPGGEAMIPQPPFESHEANLWPAMKLVLWAYTDLSDPRFTWGKGVIRLRQDTNKGPTKIGAGVAQGIATYSLNGDTFVKRFGYSESSDYPDGGCNFETFTREDMIELESLGPLVNLAPNQKTTSSETWYVLKGEVSPDDDVAAAAWLSELTIRCPHIDDF